MSGSTPDEEIEVTERDFAAVDEFFEDGDFSGFGPEDRANFARWVATIREQARREERIRQIWNTMALWGIHIVPPPE